MKVPMDGVGSGTVKGLAEAFADVLLDEKGEGAVRSEGRGGGDDVPPSATTDRPQLRMEPASSSHLGRKRRVSPPSSAARTSSQSCFDVAVAASGRKKIR